MVRLALLSAAFILSLGAASAAPSRLETAQPGTVLSAQAGVGGVARPGRWMPVDIRIRGAATGVRGSLRVEWGDAVAVRDVAVAAGTEEHVRLLLRAVAAGPTVHVTVSGDVAVPALDVPVELAALESPLTLCIGDVGLTACSVSVSEEAVPLVWRGFDLADVVVWPAAAQSARDEATRAVATWRAMRWLGDAGPADPVLAPFDAAAPAVASVATRLALFAVAVATLAALAAWARASLTMLLVIPTIGGPAAALLILNPGVLQPRAVASLQMTGVVHQFARTPQTTVAAKAELEHPRAGLLWLRPELADAILATPGPGTVRTVSTADRDGRAIYRATAALGARQRLTLDGTIDAAWLDVADAGPLRSVTNRATFALGNCQLRGTVSAWIGTLQPAARVALPPGPAPSAGDTIVCTLPLDWLAWTAPTTRVHLRGQTYFAFHFWPTPPDGAPHADR